MSYELAKIQLEETVEFFGMLHDKDSFEVY